MSPFVSGCYRGPGEFDKPKRTISEIIDSAIKEKRDRRRYSQRYDSRPTRATRKATLRMLGEHED
jgi:hypothetical protein